MPRVSIIILNWNGWRDTIECLESLYQITYPNYDVIVVDNGSGDQSIKRIKEYAEGKIEVNSKFFKYNPKNKPIKVFEVGEDEAKQGRFNRPLYEKFDVERRMILIKNKDNYGFAGGNNVGIKFVLSVLNPDYVLLLNNDTVVDGNFLGELVKVAESNERVGIVGPKIYYYDSPNIINSAGARVRWKFGFGENIGIGEIDKGQYNKVEEVDYIPGACMLIKRGVLYKTGLFDENFFILWEEMDLCIRAMKMGYKIWYYPFAKIYHKEGMARKQILPASLYYFHRNRVLFLKKHKKLSSASLTFIFSRMVGSIVYYTLKYRKNRLGFIRVLLAAYYDGIFRSDRVTEKHLYNS